MGLNNSNDPYFLNISKWMSMPQIRAWQYVKPRACWVWLDLDVIELGSVPSSGNVGFDANQTRTLFRLDSQSSLK